MHTNTLMMMVMMLLFFILFFILLFGLLLLLLFDKAKFDVFDYEVDAKNLNFKIIFKNSFWTMWSKVFFFFN